MKRNRLFRIGRSFSRHPIAILALALSLLLPLRPALCAEAVKVIFDTDMLTDPEDVTALCLLHTLADRGEADILACVVNGHDANRAGGAAVDAVNTWYNRPNILVGTYRGAYQNIVTKTSPYTKLLRDEFPHDSPDDDRLPRGVDLYRKILAQQADGSVVIASVGFLTNIDELLLSSPDSFSKLPGVELVRRKVKRIVIMGGKYPNGAEYNFNYGRIAPCTADALSRWPANVPIRFQGYELGEAIISGKAYHKTIPEKCPLRTALASNYKALYGRYSWDQLAVLDAVRGQSYCGDIYWTLHATGHNSVNSTTGENTWLDDGASSNQSYAIQAMPSARMVELLEELVLTGPTTAVSHPARR